MANEYLKDLEEHYINIARNMILMINSESRSVWEARCLLAKKIDELDEKLYMIENPVELKIARVIMKEMTEAYYKISELK